MPNIVFFAGLAGLCLLIFLLCLLLSAIDREPSEGISGSDPGNGSADNNLTDIGHVKLVADAIHSYRLERRADEGRRSRREKVTIVVLVFTAIFALGAVVAAIVSNFIFSGQLDEMRAEQRPWVYASKVVPAGHISLEDHKYFVPLQVSILNKGRLPAFAVVQKTDAKVIPVGGSTRKIRNEICGSVSLDVPNHYG